MHATRVTAVASSTEQDCDMMHAAISEARIAAQQGEIPVGAVIAKDGREICRAHNLVEQAKDATSHAEMLCLRQASKVLGRHLIIFSFCFSRCLDPNLAWICICSTR